MLKASNISKAFGDIQVLNDVSVEIEKGELISIVGASGAGKTTLLQILGTLDVPDEGSLLFDNSNLLTLNDRQLSTFRNKHIGFIFQFHHLLPEFTALENAIMPGLISKENEKRLRKKALEYFDFLNVSHRINHKPSELSGGEKQRVAVARALCNTPEIIFADEPSGNLDSKNADELNDLFLQVRKEFNIAMVIVTHNKELASIADRTLTMADGKII